MISFLGNDKVINCLHTGPIPENVINNYCYISGTFTVPKHYVDYDTQIGHDVANSGVGPYVREGCKRGEKGCGDGPYKDEISIKAYYQWVPFMLFLQAVMFYLPHLIYKAAEGHKLRVSLY